MINYRQATREELDLAIGWAADEGWNPGLNDGDIFWQTDPKGFVCAERDGEVVATGSVVAYGDAFGFMGFFIVRPDLRGQGIGREFWTWRRDLLLSRLRKGAPVGMDGVFDMQPFYAKGGFQFSHRNLRMEGVGQAGEVSGDLVALTAIPWGDVQSYDLRHFGSARTSFLRQWIEPEGGLALGVMDDGHLAGMGVVRPCRQGFKIGPLFADGPNEAKQLFAAFSNHAAGQPLYLDVPETNPWAISLASRHGMKEVFGCARMYYGKKPDLPWTQIFGVTSFELG